LSENAITAEGNAFRTIPIDGKPKKIIKSCTNNGVPLKIHMYILANCFNPLTFATCTIARNSARISPSIKEQIVSGIVIFRHGSRILGNACTNICMILSFIVFFLTVNP
jgi:hypothetical protein